MLSKSDWDFIITSLRFTRERFESYNYPDNETRNQRLSDVEGVIDRARNARKEARAGH